MERRGIENEKNILKFFNRDKNVFYNDLKENEINPEYNSKNLDKFEYIFWGKYDILLEKWLEYYDFEDIHFVKVEDMFEKPSDVFVQVCEFLNIEILIPNDLSNFNFGGKKNTSENDELISFLVDEYKSSVANFQKMIVKNFNWKYFD